MLPVMEQSEEKHYSNHGAVRNEVKPSGHRRSWAHDYSEVGTYMVTIVTEGRARVFGHIEGSAMATKRLDKEAWMRDWKAPHMVLSELGRRVLEEEVPKITMVYPQVDVWRVAMMPDHIHILIRVKERLPEGKHLGSIIRGFKTGCTRAWWALQNAVINPAAAAKRQPSGETLGTEASNEGTEKQAAVVVIVPEASPSGYNAGIPEEKGLRPVLFESGYHDRIINRPGMLENIKRYMLENPLRARIREECPRLMERQLHLWIGGREYAAYGNLFLLKYPMKAQVFFHRFTQVDAEERASILAAVALTDKERERMAIDSRVAPTHLTKAYANERAQLIQQADEGTVLVTPGISRGESLVANQAIDEGYPLILLQAQPISRYWKPSERRFFACAEGRMLILSPWQMDGISNYEHFHTLNDLAKEICEATEMRIMNYTELTSSPK